MNPIGSLRLRVTIFLVSLVTIAVEIALMRELALRFWDHLAWLVISIALLGFGISGTLLVLLQRFSPLTNRTLRFTSLLCLTMSIPICLWLSDAVEIDLLQMVWQPTLIWRLGFLEVVFTVPFIFGGMYVGLALQDTPEKVPGHYGAGFLGSATGGTLVLPALFAFSPRQIMIGGTCVILVAALLHVREKIRKTAWFCTGLLLTIMILQLPPAPQISSDKDLPQLTAMPESEIVARRAGPQGLIHIVKAPAFHAAPGLSLAYNKPLPDQLLVTLDGHLVGSLYNHDSKDDFAFVDNTTLALPYHLENQERVLIGDEAGIARIGLSLYHGAREITALTVNSPLATLKRDEIAPFIGNLYHRPEVTFLTNTLRAFISSSDSSYSLIDLGVTGEDFGGLKAATTNAVLTLETFTSCFERLEEHGMLSITTHAHVPPRESLRLLNMFIELLINKDRDPRNHIAMIRSWATVSLVATKAELTTDQANRIRSFCHSRGFDLVWLPDLTPAETNQYHVLDEPQYYLGATALLETRNDRFISNYNYDLTSPDDTKPFFHHFSRSFRLGDFSSQLGKRSLSFAEIGKLLLIAAFGQATLLSFAFIILPVIPAVGIPGIRSEQLLVVGFFAAIGFGFMLLEMGLLQRLEIYLGHPVYAAAAVLSGFLFFGGIGSIISSGFTSPLARRHSGIGFAIVLFAILYLLLLDTLLTMTEGTMLPTRVIIVIVVIAPLALLMGMMFPLGLKRVGYAQAQLIPWAWSVNGFTSVLATLLAPLLAMHWGFDVVIWVAAVCYGCAALFSLGLPTGYLKIENG